MHKVKKKKLSLPAFLLSGLISAAVCFFLFKFAFYAGWRFDILKENHWHYLINKWNAGWVMDTPREMLFFAGLVSVIPVWLIAWFLTYILPWKAVLLFPLTLLKKRKAEKLLQKSIEAAKGPENIQAALAAKKLSPPKILIKSPKYRQKKFLKSISCAEKPHIHRHLRLSINNNRHKMPGLLKNRYPNGLRVLPVRQAVPKNLPLTKNCKPCRHGLLWLN